MVSKCRMNPNSFSQSTNPVNVAGCEIMNSTFSLEHLFYTLLHGECHREFSVIPGVDGAWPARALRHHAEGNAQHLSRLHAAVHHCLGKHMHFIHFMSFFVYCHRIWLLYMLQLLTLLSKVTYNNYICQKKINNIICLSVQ